MDTESQTFGLKDGRLLGYGEWGDSDGIPVFLFHGTPGSRILTRAFDAAARDKGFRLIGVDRPGYGLSTFQEGRTILDFPWAGPAGVLMSLLVRMRSRSAS